MARRKTESKAARERAAHYSVTDGRVAVGSIREVAGVFTAVTTNDVIMCTFGSLREAAAALPGGGAQ
jgi:hypothetical protein